MTTVNHFTVTMWAIATRPYAEKIVDSRIFLDEEGAIEKCAELNNEYKLSTNTDSEPYKVFVLNGFMTDAEDTAKVEKAIEEIDSLNVEFSTTKMADLYGEKKERFSAVRKALAKVGEVQYLTHYQMTLFELRGFLIDLVNPCSKLENIENQARMALRNTPRPYPKDSIIGYADMQAILVEDNGSSLIVKFDGDVVQWRWHLDGESCRLIALPKK